jgi:tetratricopeptide (TPR) repeat protein
MRDGRILNREEWMDLTEVFVLYIQKITKESFMREKICLFILVIFCLSFSFSAQEEADLIQQGDDLFDQMSDMETAQKALALYREALGKVENKYEAYWRIARMMYYIGVHTESKKEQKTIFSQGVYNATKAVDMEPEKPEGHYWHGVNNGKVGEVRGVLKSLSLVKPIKAAMNKVIELDRSFNDGGADRVLGRVYFKLPGFAGGSSDKSLEHLLKSKEFGPEDATTRLYLAETYLKKKEVEKARAELEYILNMEDDPRWFKDIGESKMAAKELLESKKFK